MPYYSLQAIRHKLSSCIT